VTAPLRIIACACLILIGVPVIRANAQDREPNFARDVTPFLQSYCTDCHGDEDPQGGLALSRYEESGNVQTDFEVWDNVLRMLSEGEMPPEDAEQPKAGELQTAIRGIEAELAKFDCGTERHAGRVTIRRLNRAEYNNTIRDLIGIDFQPADDFPTDDVGHGFDNMGDVLSIPPLLMEKYLDAAESIVSRIAEDESLQKELFPTTADDTGGQRQADRRNLERFAARAFRRPATSAEIDRLMKLIEFAREQDSDRGEAFGLAVTAILASPHFVFRVESDPSEDEGIRQLNDYELATRLSYFLWSSMPDEELFRLAAENKLNNEDTIRRQVDRMLDDPKAKALTENFAGQWLQLRSLKDMAPDPERYPGFNDELRAAMQRETELFFESIVREDRSILEFLTADYSFVNAPLAKHYGIEGVSGEEFQRVKLDSKRRGVLTQGSILLLTSNPTRTSPVKRGKWVLDNILGEPPPEPPAGVPELDEDAETLGSLRERLEQHRADPTCAVCHRKMDALGFGLENFDVVGAWRDRDGRFEIDPSGEIGGLEFDSASSLMNLLAEHKQRSFCRCLAEKVLIYAVGRGPRPYDRCTLDGIVSDLEANDFRFRALVKSIVLSDPFRFRQLKD